MKAETQKTIQEILRRVVAGAIPVRWRSQSGVPGAGERKSFSRGSNGYDVASRLEYEPGDDPRDIDWAATAQTGGQVVLTTQYMEPREIKVFVLIDVGPTMDFGTARVNKRQLAAELAASVINSAKETNDKVGVIVYSDHAVETSISPRSAQTALIPSLVSIIEAQGSKKGAQSGLATALAMLPRQRALVFVISDFLHLSENDAQGEVKRSLLSRLFDRTTGGGENAADKERRSQSLKAIKRAATVHDVTCLVIQDRRERELPAPTGWLPELLTMQDIRTGQRHSIWLTKKNRRTFAETARRQTETLLAFLKSAHCDRAVFSTEEGEAAIPKIMRLFSAHRS